jgi:hypothetical protein
MEMQSLHARAEARETELAQWQQQSLGPANRQTIIECIGKLFTRCACDCLLHVHVLILCCVVNACIKSVLQS